MINFNPEAPSQDREKDHEIPVSKTTLHKIREEFDFKDAVPSENHTDSIIECVMALLSGEADPSETYTSDEIYGGYVPQKEAQTPIAYLQEHNSLHVLGQVAEEFDIDLGGLGLNISDQRL